MPSVIEFGSAVGAGAVAVFLGLACWPQIEHSASGKPVVSQPVFIARSAPAGVTMVAQASDQAPVGSIGPVPARAGEDAAALAKLALALQSKQGASAPAAAMRPLALAAATSSGANASEAARRLCAQGLVALADGDIAGARLYLERAADDGDARALLVLGETYDPTALARMGALGVKGEAARARDYYARALAAGMGVARERIAALGS
jgi:hypothetical protein